MHPKPANQQDNDTYTDGQNGKGPPDGCICNAEDRGNEHANVLPMNLLEGKP
jgi:hypothetical protein